MSTGAETASPLTLTDLLAAWRHRWRLLCVATGVGALLGTLAWVAAPTAYQAVTVVQVQSDEPDQIDMAAEEAVAVSRRVTSEALIALDDHSLTIDQLESTAAAGAVDSSHVLRVTFSASTPPAAARGADALAQAYLAARAVDSADADADSAPVGQIVDPARTPVAPAGPGWLAWLLGGTTLGLLVAAPVAARTSRTQAARAS